MKIKTHALPIVITPGEPAGIGPDCVLKWSLQFPALSAVVIADYNMLQARAEELKINIALHFYDAKQIWPPSKPGLYIQHVPLTTSAKSGILDVENVPYVLQCIRLATIGCRDKQFHAMVTGPIHKGIINQSGLFFSGHTEWIAELLGVAHPVMLLAAQLLRVVLVTTHLPLAAVPAAITKDRLQTIITVAVQDLIHRFGISVPRVLVCGLNPHAGEGGHLGREEIEVIIPTLEHLKKLGYHLLGPVPADTAFLPEHLANVDVVVCMYHDQGLPVIKSHFFNEAVNVTLGLPIIRTSVDHGTALHLAGTGRAQSDSLAAAIRLAKKLHI